ncbi:hypothetical protein KR200_008852, partial [Drosophila serrata]
AARLQEMQRKFIPYQPAPALGQYPPEPENDRRMYVPSLNQSLTHRDIFNYFSAFGDLERVCVKNGVDSLNYAIVIFFRTTSMQMAIAANPHLIKGHRLLCRKAADKSSNTAVRPTNPKRTLLEDNPVPLALAVKPPENQPKKLIGKFELEQQKKTLTGTRSMQGDYMNFNIKPKENLIKSKKSVVPPKGNQTFVYATAAPGRKSRWNFSLAGGYTTPEEKEALREGYPDAAKKLLEVQTKKYLNSSIKPINLIKRTVPLKTQDQNHPLSIAKHIPDSSRIPVSQPPARLRRQSILLTHDELISVSKHVSVPAQNPLQMISIPNPKPVPSVLPNLEISKPKTKDLKGFPSSPYFGTDFRYEHHCYTNVVAYQKTKLYIDLEPGERERRKTIKEFIDEKYGMGI